MKTQIIQLNKHDDYVSVRDRMGWSQTRRILLVWPDGEGILDRQLELHLLQRHAQKLGAQLALVTHDADVRSDARQIGLPVFSNANSGQDQEWHEKRHKNSLDLVKKSGAELENLRKLAYPQSSPWTEHPFSRVVFFAISVLALLVLGVFTLPSATIMISPRTETQSIRLSLTANPSITAVSIPTGSLPTVMKEVIVEGRKTAETTGEAVIPDQFATGVLNFSNISDHTITIPKGTLVVTRGDSPVRFITTFTDEVIVEPGESIDISARCLIPGMIGNLPPNSLSNIVGALSSELLVTNPDATQGGSDASVPAPSEQDIQSLRESLLIELEQSALSELQANLLEDDTLIIPSLALVEIIEETPTPPIGEPGKQLDLSLRARFQSQVVSGEMLRNLVKPIMDSNTPVGYVPVENSLVFFRLSQPNYGEDESAHWNIIAQRKLQVNISTVQAVDAVRGLPVPQAIEHLTQSLPLQQSNISVSPTWWPRLPYLTMRIKLVQLDTK